MDDPELKKLREQFADAEAKRPRSKIKAFVKKMAARLGPEPKEDDFKRFRPKRRKKI